MQLGKVKLINDGLKGLQISYIEHTTRSGNTYIDQYDSVFLRTPIPPAMKGIFMKLKEHFINICTLDRKYMKEDMIRITGVMGNGEDYFEILAEVGGLYTGLKLRHEQVTAENNYPKFAEVNEIIQEIYAAVEQYRQAKIVQSAEQMLLDFKSDKKFGKTLIDVDIDSMSKEEQEEAARKILESMGAIVMMPSDFDLTADDSNSPVDDSNVNNGSKKRKQA